MADERIFETYLDSVTFDGKTKWFTEPPFDMLREIAEASDEIFKMVFKKFNLKTTDAEDANLISLIKDYAVDHSVKAFDRLPSRLQSRIRILHEKMNKNSKQSTDFSSEWSRSPGNFCFCQTAVWFSFLFSAARMLLF